MKKVDLVAQVGQDRPGPGTAPPERIVVGVMLAQGPDTLHRDKLTKPRDHVAGMAHKGMTAPVVAGDQGQAQLLCPNAQQIGIRQRFGQWLFHQHGPAPLQTVQRRPGVVGRRGGDDGALGGRRNRVKPRHGWQAHVAQSGTAVRIRLDHGGQVNDVRGKRTFDVPHPDRTATDDT